MTKRPMVTGIDKSVSSGRDPICGSCCNVFDVLRPASALATRHTPVDNTASTRAQTRCRLRCSYSLLTEPVPICSCRTILRSSTGWNETRCAGTGAVECVEVDGDAVG